MTRREAIDKAIEMRQQVIDGGVLWYKDIASIRNIINNADDFGFLVLDINQYTVRMPVNEKRIPLTEDDLYKRFESMKTIEGDHTTEIENMKRCGICDNYKSRSGLCHIDNDIVNRADRCRFDPSEWEMIEE